MTVNSITSKQCRRPIWRSNGQNICACAIFAHPFVSIRDDFEIWLGRTTCVQTLHTERNKSISGPISR
jgi:hypothetical protein